MVKIIPILLLTLVLSGCSMSEYVTNLACNRCATERVIQLPPPLELIPQESLTLQPPRFKLIRPSEGDSYFQLTQDDFLLWVSNEKQIQNFIIECTDRTLKTRAYYEGSLESLR